MFSSLTQPDVLEFSSNHLSSTTVIRNLKDNDATTEDEQPQVDNIEKKEKSRRNLCPSDLVELDTGQEVDHRPPTTKGETTNQRGGRWICSSRTTTGGLHRTGRGNCASYLPIPLTVEAIHRLAKTRPRGGADEPYYRYPLT